MPRRLFRGDWPPLLKGARPIRDFDGSEIEGAARSPAKAAGAAASGALALPASPRWADLVGSET